MATMINKMKCMMGIHHYTLIATDDTFHSTYPDNFKKYWLMSFYQCSHCNKRKFEDTYSGTYGHIGIQRTKVEWIQVGKITNSAVKYNTPEPTKSSQIIKLKCIDGDKK